MDIIHLCKIINEYIDHKLPYERELRWVTYRIKGTLKLARCCPFGHHEIFDNHKICYIFEKYMIKRFGEEWSITTK